MSMQVKASRVGALRGGSLMPGMSTSQRTTVARSAMAYGDPGLLDSIGGFLGGALKTVGGVVSMVPGVGGVAGGALGAVGNLLAPQEAPDLPDLVQQAPVGGITGIGQRLVPGGASGYAYTEQQIRNGKNRAGQRIPGTNKRWNKAPYTLKDGTYIPAGMRKVTIRKRNALNPRALDRALSRVSSAKRASKKLSRVTIRKASACR